MVARGAPSHVLWLTVVTGVLIGSTVFLGAKVSNPPPLDPMDVDFHELLGRPMPSVPLEPLPGTPEASLATGAVRVVVLAADSCADWDRICLLLRVASQQVPVALVGTGHRDQMAAKAAQLGPACSVALDSAGALAARLGVTGYPTTFLLDAHGRVVRAAEGVAYLSRILELAVGGQARSRPSLHGPG
jgi:hypothetical protein